MVGWKAEKGKSVG